MLERRGHLRNESGGQAPMRLACPACLGVALEKVTAAPGAYIDHCPRCGGTWILHARTAQLRAVPAAALRAAITRRDDAGFLCHNCHFPMPRDVEACVWCKWRNVLECPGCGKEMARKSERGTTVDVCRGCRGVWLDHHELSVIWAVAAAGAVASSGMASRVGAAGADAGGFLLEALWYAPDLVIHGTAAAVHATAHVVGAGAEAVAGAPDLVAFAPEAAAGAAEVAVEAAGGVFEFIAEIIGGIFECFG